jgi:hypothetical protein
VDDPSLGIELARRIGCCLELTTTAAIDTIMHTRRLDAIRGWLENGVDRSARESLPHIQPGTHTITGCGARNEDHDSITPRYAVTTGGDTLDREPRRLSSQCLAAARLRPRVRRDTGTEATDAARFGAWRSRSR